MPFRRLGYLVVTSAVLGACDSTLFLCIEITLNKTDSAVEFTTNGDGMKKFPLAALFALATLAFGQDKCIDLCSSCMNNDRQDVCAKVEALCKCTEMLNNLQQELANPNPVTTADSIAADTAQAGQAALDTNALQTDTIAKVDSTTHKDSAISVEPSPSEQNSGEIVYVSTETGKVEEEKTPSPEKKERFFYLGVSLGYEEFQEKTVANHEVKEADDFYEHIGANLGLLLRWYLYRSVSFQFGLNAIYHHGYNQIKESDFRIGGDRYYYGHDVSINYHSIMAEIPLTFRFGIPFVISPYISLSIHVRKPIYAWIDYDADVDVRLGDYYNYNNSNYHYDDYGSYDGDFTEEDWEFLSYLGFGIEFTRHISIQWQMLLIDAVTYTNEILNYKLLTDTWRLNLDIAF